MLGFSRVWTCAAPTSPGLISGRRFWMGPTFAALTSPELSLSPQAFGDAILTALTSMVLRRPLPASVELRWGAVTHAWRHSLVPTYVMLTSLKLYCGEVDLTLPIWAVRP